MEIRMKAHATKNDSTVIPFNFLTINNSHENSMGKRNISIICLYDSKLLLGDISDKYAISVKVAFVHIGQQYPSYRILIQLSVSSWWFCQSSGG
jgi:hypothetical protein